MSSRFGWGSHISWLLVAVFFLAGAGILCAAESWNAYNDFSSTAFPVHDWSYVYQPGSVWDGSWNLGLMTRAPEPNWWQAFIAPSYYGPQAGLTSEWSRIKTTSCKKGDGGAKSPALGLLQWTAPQGGYYRFSGDAYLYPQTTSRLFAVTNRLTQPFLNSTISTTFEAQPFDKTVLLNPSDKVVFGGEPVVGGGPYESMGSYWTVNVGRIPSVPAPWTPLIVNGSSISCWNRTYDFTNSILPASITSGGVNLLSGPIQLVPKISGVQQNWSTTTFTVDQSDQDVVTVTTVGTSSSLTATCKLRFEFDGFVLCDLTLSPQSGTVTLSSLNLLIPFNTNYAKLFHHHPIKPLTQQNWGIDAMNCGAIPSAGKTLPWVHHIWIGDENRGLQWFAESDQGLSPVGNFISLNSSKSMTMSLLGTKSISVSQPFHFVFGFMASPVKPMVPADEVRWAFPGGGIGIWNHDYNGTPVSPDKSWLAQLDGKGVNCLNLWDSQDMFGDPMISNPDLPNLLNAGDGYGIGILSSTGVWVDERTPGYNTTWDIGPRFSWSDPSVPEVIAHAACQRSPWRPWFLDHAERVFSQKSLDGWYLDGSGTPQICSNTSHGCGYYSGPTLKGTLPILSTRELMKQLYLISRSGSGRKYILAHTSASVNLPCLSFADAYLEGEHINGYPEVNQPLNSYNNTTYTIEGFRAEMMGHQYGIPAFYLKYPKQGYATEDIRRCTTYALVHGMLPLALDHAPAAWKAYRDFDAEGAQWIPYWDATPKPIFSPADVKISSYVKPGVGALSVVANLNQVSVTATLQIDREALGLDERARVRDLITGEDLSLDPEVASVTLLPGSYALLQTDYYLSDNVNLISKPEGGATTAYTASTTLDAPHAAMYAADGNVNTGWQSTLEPWKTYPIPRPAVCWWQVEWSLPQTFNRVEVYLPSESGYIPVEFVLEVWDSVGAKWSELSYAKKTDNALTYLLYLPQAVTTTKLRYRVVTMEAFSYGPNTRGGLQEIKVFNNDSSGWGTVVGTITDSNGNPVKGAHTFLHLTPDSNDPFNWENIHVLGTRSGNDGSYRITVNPAAGEGLTGMDKVVVQANGMSMDASTPSIGIASAPVSITAGQTSTCNVFLPGPSIAYLELGGAAPGPWLTQSLNIPMTNWEVINTAAGGKPCVSVWPGIEMCLNLNKTFADGRFDRMYVDVEYFDEGKDAVRMMVPPISDYFDGSWYVSARTLIRKENTMTWRKQTLVVENSFMNGWWQSGGQSAMFSLVPFADGTALLLEGDDYFASVGVRFAPKQFAQPPSVSFGTTGTAGSHPALRFEDKGLHVRLIPALLGDNLGTVEDNVGGTGRPGYVTAGTRRFITLDLDNDCIFGAAEAVALKVDYFDDNASGAIRLDMLSTGGGTVSKSIQKTGSGDWKTAVVTFNNVKVSDNYYNCGDILLDDGGEDDTISAIALLPVQSAASVNTIAEAKGRNEFTAVSLPARTVTATFDGFFYIEEDDRSSGIKVVGSTSALPGQEVAVNGYLVKNAGEWEIHASSISAPSPSTAIPPVGIGNAVTESPGLSVTGLLVRIWGKVVSGEGSPVFEISDGAGAPVKVIAPSGYSAPSAGSFVVVTGICTVSGTSPAILARDPSDIR